MSTQKRLFFLCGGIALCVLVIFAVMWFRRPAPVPVFDPVAAHASWQQLIAQDILPLSASSSVEDVRQRRERLLQLTVTAEDRDAHMSLVMALLALERGEPGAYERVQRLAHESSRPE